MPQTGPVLYRMDHGRKKNAAIVKILISTGMMLFMVSCNGSSEPVIGDVEFPGGPASSAVG